MNADMAALDFTTRTLMTAKGERRRQHEAEMADLLDEGKRLERERANWRPWYEIMRRGWK